jgi:hypothetical protein
MDNPIYIPSPTTSHADLLIRRTTTGTVLFLAVVAGVVSYGHMHELALRYGQEPWAAALLPLSVDGMIVAASLALLWDSRRGRRGGILPWTLLVIASGASLAANVAAAHPMLISRIISAWPPFALIGAYEMLMRQIRHSIARQPLTHRADAAAAADPQQIGVQRHGAIAARMPETAPAARQLAVAARSKCREGAEHVQRQAWQWALSHRLPSGDLPTGEAIAKAFERSSRWGRLVKSAGHSGQYDQDAERRVA